MEEEKKEVWLDDPPEEDSEESQESEIDEKCHCPKCKPLNKERDCQLQTRGLSELPGFRKEEKSKGKALKDLKEKLW